MGCGVSGLSTGICLQESGYAVDIWARELPPFTTSDRAAAVWFPYEVGPPEHVGKWSRATFEAFLDLSMDENSGVYMDDLLMVGHEMAEIEPIWAKLLPSDAWSVVGGNELPSTYMTGYKVMVPFIETPIYMQYLVDRFKGNGGKIGQQAIEDFSDLPNDYAAYVNCTGLGAAALAQDAQLYPILGLTLCGKLEAEFPYLAKIIDDGGPNSIGYIFPRRLSGDVLLGGTAIKGANGEAIDSKMYAEMQARCFNIYPELEQIGVWTSNFGLRPGRIEIRLERDRADPKLIHNYGHGGGGFTVSWGCAQEVVRLVAAL